MEGRVEGLIVVTSDGRMDGCDDVGSGIGAFEGDTDGNGVITIEGKLVGV